MFRILFKKILLTIQFVFFLLIYKTKLVLLGVSYTLVVVHHPINFYDLLFWGGFGTSQEHNRWKKSCTNFVKKLTNTF